MKNFSIYLFFYAYFEVLKNYNFQNAAFSILRKRCNKVFNVFAGFSVNSSPHNRLISSSCVILLKDAKRLYEVITLCQQAIAIDPYEESLHYELIRALLDTGAQQAALTHYEYVVDLSADL